MKPKIPVVQFAGTIQFPRTYVAAAERDRPPQYFWNAISKSWCPRHQGTLFANLNDVCLEVQKIQQQQYAGLPIRTFTVPIELDFYGDLEMSQATLVDWLRQAVRFTISYGEFGNGPTTDTLVLPLLLWDQTKELGIEKPQE